MPSGVYTNSKKNKEYGLKAVKILREINKDQDINQRLLWKEVIGDQDVVQLTNGCSPCFMERRNDKALSG
ncbi:DUF6979 family protein [Paenibacillus sp. FSL R7-0340]|uniref:DUF6979 family protein n=1 Tax=Paenibacillus sp. FSL R7-0340 TaxID=2921684 RepID=UPI004046FF5F